VLMVGAKFGVAIILRQGRVIEVATFRSDVAYSDGRHPDRVVFSSAQQDALRRDFTINGMFLDPMTGQTIDYVDGQRDLQAGIIRAIGRADLRFQEDYLRMLRGVRFAARFNFALEGDTAAAIRRHAGKISQISGERIREELEKIFEFPRGRTAMDLMQQLDLAGPVFGPSVAAAEAWPAAMERLARLEDQCDPTLSLAAVLGGQDIAVIAALLRRWGSSNELRTLLVWLAAHLGKGATAPDMPLATLKRLMAHDGWPRLRRLWRAEEERLTGKGTQARRLARRIRQIDPAQIAPAPLVTGEDLKALGLSEGRRLGAILRTLYESQLDEQLRTKEQAIARAKELMASEG
jgi:poly(A) polymerase